jgi:hypothetical protein
MLELRFQQRKKEKQKVTLELNLPSLNIKAMLLKLEFSNSLQDSWVLKKLETPNFHLPKKKLYVLFHSIQKQREEQLLLIDKTVMSECTPKVPQMFFSIWFHLPLFQVEVKTGTDLQELKVLNHLLKLCKNLVTLHPLIQIFSRLALKIMLVKLIELF